MNKKLIKTIASITCGLGIVSSITSIITGCSNNVTPIDPAEMFDFDCSTGTITSLNVDLTETDLPVKQ